MKVFVSIDLEGISGVCRLAQIERGSDEWRAARRLMRGDLDAVLEGCLEGGADEVVVCDAHDQGDNLDAEGLPAGVSLVSGGGMDLSMMAGIDANCDAVMMVGYHARAGTLRGTLAHTYTFGVADAVVCGAPDGELPTGELGLNAALAAALGVPLVFASGDDKLAAEARALLPGIETVTVKQGLAWSGARLIGPEQARAELRAGARRALRAAPPPLLDWKGRSLRVRFGRPDWCDNAAGCPGTTRIDGTTIEITAPDWVGVFARFVAAVRLAYAD
jgi:D-amino peptidase